MPFIRITLCPGRPQVHGAIASETTRLMADILGKKAALTAVLVEDSVGTWTIGGMAGQACAVHMEAIITAGTNSDGQKAAFIAQAMEMLRRHCGALPEASYVVVREVVAENWGYDGRTQASRRSPF